MLLLEVIILEMIKEVDVRLGYSSKVKSTSSLITELWSIKRGLNLAKEMRYKGGGGINTEKPE